MDIETNGDGIMVKNNKPISLLDFGNAEWVFPLNFVPVVDKDGKPWEGIVHPVVHPDIHISGPQGSIKDFMKNWVGAIQDDPYKEMAVPQMDLLLVTTAVRYVIKARRQKGGSLRQRKAKFQQARHQATVVVKTEKFNNVVPANIQIEGIS